MYAICILFLFTFDADNHKDADDVGNHCEAVEANSHVVEVNKVIYKPENLSGYDDNLEFNFAFCVEKPCEKHSGSYGQNGQRPFVHKGIQGKDYLNKDKSYLEPKCAFPFGEAYVSCNAYDVCNKAGGAAEDKVGSSLKCELNALG